MKTFKFLRILFLAIFSLSIISCTNNGEDDDMGSLSSSSGKSYKKLVQMNIKDVDEDEEERVYFNYNKDGILTSVDIADYDDGLFDGEERFYLKWDKNALYFSENGVEYYEEYYQISDGKVVKGEDDIVFEYDNNGRILCEYSEGDENKTIYTWEEGKLMKTTYSYRDDYEWGVSYSYSKNTKYEYSSHNQQRCNGFFPNMAEEYSELYDLCAMPWMVGMDQQALPIKIETESVRLTKEDGYESVSGDRKKRLFTYSYYDDGYLKTCTERVSGYSYGSPVVNAFEYTQVYEYFWQ